MKRLLVLPLLAVALVATACGSTTAPAATVNGAEISDAALRDEIRALADNPGFAQAFLGVAPGGDGESTVDASFAAQVLTVNVVLSLVDQEAATRGLEPTDEDLDVVRATLGPEILALFEQMPADYQSEFLRWNAQLELLRQDLAEAPAEVTDEDVRTFYDENVAGLEQSCLSHVLVETEAEAETVLAEIEAGLDFAEAAARYSTDPSAASNGGDLGCNAPGTFVPGFEEAAFADAPLGEPYGPVESQFGFHLLLVRERGSATFEEVESEIRAQLEAQSASAPQQALATWIQGAVAEADVTVSSRYGSWDAATGSVVPPESPADQPGTVSFG